MSEESRSSNVRQDTFFIECLQLIFITLKLLGKIDWSWWWVLAPAWSSALLLVLVLIVIAKLKD